MKKAPIFKLFENESEKSKSIHLMSILGEDSKKQTKQHASSICYSQTDEEKCELSTLMQRKLSLVATSKSAFCIVALVLYYCLKVKILSKMQRQQKERKRKTLKANLEKIKENYFPFNL